MHDESLWASVHVGLLASVNLRACVERREIAARECCVLWGSLCDSYHRVEFNVKVENNILTDEVVF